MVCDADKQLEGLSTTTITSLLPKKLKLQSEQAAVTVQSQHPLPPASRDYNLKDDKFVNIGFHEAIENCTNPDTYHLMLRHVLRSVEVETGSSHAALGTRTA